MEEFTRKEQSHQFVVSVSDFIPLTTIWMGEDILTLVGMTVIGYWYFKSKKEAFLSAIMLSISTMAFGSLQEASYVVGMNLLLFLLLEIIKYLNGNQIRWMSVGIVAVSAVYCIYLHTPFQQSLLFLFGEILVFEQIKQDVIGKHCKVIHNLIYLSVVIWVNLLFPDYQVGISMIVIVLVCLRNDINTVLISLLFTYVLLPFQIDVKYYLFIIVCAYFHNQLFLLTVCGIGGALYSSSFMMLGIYGCFLCVYCYDSLTQVKEESYECSKQQKDFKRRLHNFSIIFDTLSDYYASISPVQSEMLGSMSEALSYSASTMYLHALKEDREYKILKTLEAYRYEIEIFEYDESDDGIVHIRLVLRNVKEEECRETILPLLENLCECHLYMKDLHNRRFLKGWHEMEFESIQSFQLDAYGASLCQESQCGDSYSIFSYRQYHICMISDGMGSGKRASEVSRSITTIFQRMISSDIPMDISIRCMNKLLQSDVFATMDVITFDLNQKIAYLFKSAACPTFLIRNGELLEISGSNLPVGILDSIDADCYTLQLKENDSFFMFSDGVNLNEVYEWLKYQHHGNAKQQVNHMMEILSRTKRKDDSTVVYAKVLKNS